MPRLAIFDFDGTLADTWPWFVRVLDEAALRFGFRRIDAAEAERLRGLPSRAIMRALAIPWWKLPRVVAYGRRRAADQRAELALFPGAADTLHALADAGHTLAIVSSNAEATIRHVLGSETAARVAVYACGAAMFGKPKHFRQALRRSGCAAGDAIAIGDEVRDVDAARAVGIASGAVTWGYATADALRRAEPTHVFDSFAALRARLLAQ